MRTLKLKDGTRVRIYDSVDELPIDRFHRFNRYVMIDAGIGGDPDSITIHLSQLARLIQKRNDKLALTKIENLHQSIHLAVTGMHPRSLAMTVLIHDINGKPVEDLQEENLKRIADDLGKRGLFNNQAQEIVDLAKKKYQDELSTLYPEIFNEADDLSWISMIKKRTLLLGRQVLGEDTEGELQDLTEQMQDQIPVESYQGPEGKEAKYERDFEAMTLAAGRYTSRDPKQMTTKEYYALVSFAKSEAKKEKKAQERWKQKKRTGR